MKNSTKLILCLLLPLLVGAISGFATMESISGWYSHLNKPSFNPPDYLFGPVWTVLYILMGISSYRIVRSYPQLIKTSVGGIYFAQLFFNFLWSFLFFNFHVIGIALIDIIWLWVCILFMVIAFYRVDKTAALLQVPYLLWVSFATALNASIFFLN